MSPRAKAHVKATMDSMPMRWASILMPLFLAAFSLRISRENKQDNTTTAESVSALVQDGASNEQRNQAEDRRLLRLEREVMRLNARLGSARRSVGGRLTGSEPAPAASAEPSHFTLRGMIGGALHFLFGG